VEPLILSMNCIPFIGLSALIMGVRPLMAASASGEGGQKQVLAILRADIAEKPSRVLIAVEDALTMNEQAACEIVKAAIEATRADARLVGEIVHTALKNAPGMAAGIMECALNASPGSEEQIKEAMRRALGEKAIAAAGKEGETKADAAPSRTTAKEGSGKGAVPEAPDQSGIEDSFDLSRIGVGGIYLVTPARGAIHFCDPRDPCCNSDLSQACLRP
jgi:hypothetical protein